LKIGYERNITEEIREKFLLAGVKMVYLCPDDGETDIKCFEQFLLSHSNITVVLNDLNSIGNFTIIQLYDLFQVTEERKITLTFLNCSIQGVTIENNFLEVVYAFAKHEKQAHYMRTMRGIDVAKSNGKVGGRPTIPKEVQERIHYMKSVEKKSYRQISNDLNISIGTAYKYAE